MKLINAVVIVLLAIIIGCVVVMVNAKGLEKVESGIVYDEPTSSAAETLFISGCMEEATYRECKCITDVIVNAIGVDGLVDMSIIYDATGDFSFDPETEDKILGCFEL